VTVGRAARSFYWWEGKICGEKECLLLIKTKASLFGRLEKRIKEIHSYTVPEIIALPIEKGSAEYLGWLDKETRS
jgi:periplasmic divalent cation tolerance protein